MTILLNTSGYTMEATLLNAEIARLENMVNTVTSENLLPYIITTCRDFVCFDVFKNTYYAWFEDICMTTKIYYLENIFDACKAENETMVEYNMLHGKTYVDEMNFRWKSFTDMDLSELAQFLCTRLYMYLGSRLCNWYLHTFSNGTHEECASCRQRILSVLRLLLRDTKIDMIAKKRILGLLRQEMKHHPYFLLNYQGHFDKDRSLVGFENGYFNLKTLIFSSHKHDMPVAMSTYYFFCNRRFHNFRRYIAQHGREGIFIYDYMRSIMKDVHIDEFLQAMACSFVGESSPLVLWLIEADVKNRHVSVFWKFLSLLMGEYYDDLTTVSKKINWLRFMQQKDVVRMIRVTPKQALEIEQHHRVFDSQYSHSYLVHCAMSDALPILNKMIAPTAPIPTCFHLSIPIIYNEDVNMPLFDPWSRNIRMQFFALLSTYWSQHQSTVGMEGMVTMFRQQIRTSLVLRCQKRIREPEEEEQAKEETSTA